MKTIIERCTSTFSLSSISTPGMLTQYSPVICLEARYQSRMPIGKTRCCLSRRECQARSQSGFEKACSLNPVTITKQSQSRDTNAYVVWTFEYRFSFVSYDTSYQRLCTSHIPLNASPNAYTSPPSMLDYHSCPPKHPPTQQSSGNVPAYEYHHRIVVEYQSERKCVPSPYRRNRYP